ncbi:hypothetical protein PYW07_015290 [Mythimna separata]|uniref:Uncharacterized protein n=1 Tax=Mythimna separata TaxID=271217 RepID=A0AAD8DYU1_MYTSE|nr:hypothetical protein PYW07_015290 [Mythimna separata]
MNGSERDRSINKLRGPKKQHSLVRTLAQQAGRRPAIILTLRPNKMHQAKRLRLAASILLWFALQALGADKYTDENRPYEFGFKIDGQQHRHESKDKDGIIMGEFGFVTADDVYHVTVYATDKEGRFKIVSMKNIHLKSAALPNFDVTTSARQGHALALPPAQPASVQATSIPQQSSKPGGFPPASAPRPQSAIAAPPQPPPKAVSIEPPGRSCSSCSLPTTTTRAPPPVFNPVNEFSAPGASSQKQPSGPSGSSYNPQGGQPAFPLSSSGQQNTAQGGSTGSSYNPQGSQPAFPPSSLGQQNIAQGGPSGSSYKPQGSQPAFPPSSSGQQNAAQGGSTGSLYNTQGSQPAFPPSPSGQQNIAQGGPGGPSYNPQGSQPVFPPSSPGQQNIAQGGPSESSYSPQGGQQAFPPSSSGQQNIAQGGPSGSSYNPQGNQQNIPQQELVAPDGAPSFAPQPGQTAQNYPGSPNYSQGPGSSNVPNAQQRGAFPPTGQTQSGAGQKASVSGGNNNQYTGAGLSGSSNTSPDAGRFSQNNAQQAGLSQGGAGERTAKQYVPEQQYDSGPNSPQGPGAAPGGPRGSAKPTLFSAQMQIVDKNTDIYALGPNEQKGLPPGLSQGDMTQLLYTFNYTLGFHGHFEEGYANGVKKGYYFVTGRNGVRTRIDYVADDTGFHPKVSQEVLDLLSEDVPKPETEKDEKYGLKGYEFKWLYYPVESKRK